MHICFPDISSPSNPAHLSGLRAPAAAGHWIRPWGSWRRRRGRSVFRRGCSLWWSAAALKESPGSGSWRSGCSRSPHGSSGVKITMKNVNRKPQHAHKGMREDGVYLEEGEVPVTLNLSDLQVSHDDLTAVVPVFNQVVLILLRARGAHSILRTWTHLWHIGRGFTYFNHVLKQHSNGKFIIIFYVMFSQSTLQNSHRINLGLGILTKDTMEYRLEETESNHRLSG